ncbi:MAG: SMC-Scp complex subunit ScpB [Nitrospirae bacterium]|nr:MAG: SMC-Scp complex subunit ScpB [Nitrospirota bacterium]
MEDKDKKNLLEAILFLSGESVALSALKDVTETPENELKKLMDELMSEYREKNSGILISEIANGYQMITNPEYAPWLKKFRAKSASSKLSASALETLAIIAYKQPLIKAEIEQLRSVNSDGVVKTLLDRKLIKIMGRKEAPGRPLLYGTTKEFLQYFGLKDLTELPTLRDIEREEAA